MHEAVESITTWQAAVYDAEDMRLGALLPALLWSVTALGEQPELELDVKSPSGCASREQFERRLFERLAADEIRATAGIVRVEVSVQPDKDSVVGRLRTYDVEGRPSQRQISAATCDEALDALALITALAVKREREIQREQPPAPAAEPAQAPRQAREEPEPVRDSTEPDEPGLEYDFATSGLLATGTLPEPAFGLELAAGLRLPAFGTRALLRGGLRLYRHQDVGRASGRAAFEWWSAALTLCPLELVLTTTLSMAPCVVTELGRLHASGSDTTNPRSATRTWFAPGLALLGHWDVYSPLFIEISGELLMPRPRDRFHIGSELLHEVSWLGARARAGLGVRFP